MSTTKIQSLQALLSSNFYYDCVLCYGQLLTLSLINYLLLYFFC